MVWAAGAGHPKPPLNLQDITRLLEAFTRSKSLFQAKLLHQHLIKISTPHSPSQLTSPLEAICRLYASCNELGPARHVFDEIPQRPRNVLTWNQLIRAYAWNGPFEEAIELYYQMGEYGVQPSKYTFPFVLKACSALGAVWDGVEVHLHAKRLKLDEDVYVSTALVDMYAKCGCLREAREVFERMPVRDVVAWNSMIAGLSLRGEECYDEVVEFVVEMQKQVRPNLSTVAAVLPAVGQANALTHGREIHGFCVRRGFDDEVVVATGLLDMYGKCQIVDYARRMFDKMVDIRNEVTWSAIIGAYVLVDLLDEALGLFCQMVKLKGNGMLLPTAAVQAILLRGCAKFTDVKTGRCLHCYSLKSGSVADLMVANTLLSVYSKCGIVHDGLCLFDEMELRDTVSFSAIISGCVQNGNAKTALRLFHEMQLSGTEPDLATIVSILPACSDLAALRYGSCSHCLAIIHGFTIQTTVCNALIDMYAKCGSIDIARRVFNRMDQRDIISWNTMINAYGLHGLGREALLLFDEMLAKGLLPDDVTFVSLLYACSHSGLVTEGKKCFNALTRDFGIIPRMEHFICMADLLSRAGLFIEVHHLIERMPFEPDVRVWGALLAACRIYKNIELGEEVSKKIQSLGPESTGSFVLLSNMYSTVGRWNDAAQVRITQRDRGFLKTPGFSWIEVGGLVHAFVGGDMTHAQSAEICQKIRELLVQMKALGYKAESSNVFQDIEEEEKEGALLYHSEKLAIAFGILNLSQNKPILVTKNLRVCGDCHIAIKYISVIAKREIIVRDASRFHHFKDGSCSCGDFW